ncbi:MAG: DUF3800 domain-containing protein [Sphingosinicella sp.]|nr:DUF3800 domain-containing protein [Sphingosinicella sp.]
MDISIFCDESCHLEHDESPTMGLGAIWVSKVAVRQLSLELRDIKRRHRAAGELKWTKVSASRSAFYAELVDWFWRQDGLNFRCIIIPDKNHLDHCKYNNGSHDEFYYKMYFSMLNKILSPDNGHNIYIDIKDTRSNIKVTHLKDVLCNNVYDFTGQMVSKIQHVRSHEIELMQLCDFLLGAVVYTNRGLSANTAKRLVAEKITEHRGRALTTSSPLTNQKFNVFVWQARA